MKIEFVHLRQPDSPKGGLTIAMECNENDQVIATASACCSIKDNFNRKTGRQKAQGRLNSPRYRKELKDPQQRRIYIQNLYSLGPKL